MANVLRKLNKGEKVSGADLNSVDQSAETSQAEGALQPVGGGFWGLPKINVGHIPEEAFGKVNAADKAMGPFPAVTGKAVEALTRNPAQAAAFDKMFGPGQAKKWLPKQPKPVAAEALP